MDSDAMETSSDGSDFDSRLCDLCAGITAASLTSPDGYRHAENLALISSAQGSCTLCTRVWHQIDRVDPVTRRDLLRELGERPFHHVRLRAVPAAASSDSRLTREGHSLVISFETNAITHSQTLPELEVWCPVGDRAADFGIPELNVEPINTRSDKTFRFIQTCLDECRSHDCRVPLLPETAQTAPSRLVDLTRIVHGTDGIAGPVLLVDITTACPDYAALSHCWGGNLENFKTTSANLPQRRSGIDVRALSPTFRDAIEICCRLGVRFIWIDALCIVQDSAQEWNAESAIMGDIYQNAVVTISASHARDGSGGCFSDSCSTTVEEILVLITTTNQDDGPSTILMRDRKSGYVPAQDIEQSPLSSRGWIFQERFLSPRIVHFAATQVLWECRRALYQQRLHVVAAPTIPSRAKLPAGAGDAAAAVRHWHGLVTDYSLRQFTKYEDRLVAFAGVAQVFRPHMEPGARYLAGLWSSHFAKGLAWQSIDLVRTRPVITPPRHPTWSWASQNYGVQWSASGSLFDNDAAGFVLESAALDVLPTPRGDFGPVTACPIKVRGRAAPVTHIDINKLDFSGSCIMRVGDRPGDLRLDELVKLLALASQTPHVLALAIGRSYIGGFFVLIIVPSDASLRTYVRVGFGTVNVPSPDGLFGDSHAAETFVIV